MRSYSRDGVGYETREIPARLTPEIESICDLGMTYGPDNSYHSMSAKSKSLLVLSYRFPPQTYPLATRLRYFLKHLSDSYRIDAITAAEEATLDGVNIHYVDDPSPDRLLDSLRQLKLDPLIDLLRWPDPFALWTIPALRKARTLVAANKPDAIVVFMMPYSPGIAGVLLKKWTGLPLILNFNDSLTCSDMSASFPTTLHYHLAHSLENWYIRNANAAVYVSKRNMERVRQRQSPAHQDKFHLIRRGAQPLSHPSSTNNETFRIVYTGGMGGWYWFVDRSSDSSLLRSIKSNVENKLHHEVTQLDGRSHSPVYLGQAIRQITDRHPEWRGRIQLDLVGNQVDRSIVDQVLAKFDLQEVVNVYDPVPHEEAMQEVASADLLFVALPDRVDGSPGGRISAKTYEYLMTDRPILGALPPGENREYLNNRPGVYLTAPKDTEAMANVIESLASDFFNGQPVRVERPDAWTSIEHTNRAQAFERVLEQAITT